MNSTKHTINSHIPFPFNENTIFSYNNPLELIGNTPLMNIPLLTNSTLYSKLEYFNPTGSIKDRVALYIVEKAERLGLLKPGGTIIEASSGNQGISLSMIGAIKGYNVIITASNKISSEKQNGMLAYGAQLVICDGSAPFLSENHYYTKAQEIHRATPNSFFVNQYFSPDNAEAHYVSSGPELWRDTKGLITHFICGMGSGGTAAGVGRYLKEQNPDIKIIGIDSPCAYLASNKKPTPYKLDGMGIDYDTPFLDRTIIDDIWLCSDASAHAMIATLARTYGILVGPASAAVAASIKEHEDYFPKDSLIAFFSTDSGRAYFSKGYL